MKRAIILIFAMLLVMPFVFSEAIINRIEFFNTTASDDRPCRNDLWASQSFIIGTSSQNRNYNLSKIALEIGYQGSPTGALNVCLYSLGINGQPSSALVCNYTVNKTVAITANYKWWNISMPVYEMQAGTGYAVVCNGTDNGAPSQYVAQGNGNSYSAGNQSQSSDQGASWVTVTTRDVFFEIWAENGTIADVTPPSITYYNVTSDSGCESWNTNKNTACSTSSVTPTVQFNTNENAWCAIAGSSSNTSLNLNYTGMTSSRNCTGAASGEGATSHLCTLTGQDELVYETSYLFISCKDSNNNTGLNSTSGALSLSITGLEAAGRTSIGLGIQNALLSGYTNYTDLQIYARNLSNAQVKGTFDRAAKKGSKMWAFNRIGVSDSHVNMFNLTPVLYTLELSNKTSANITLQVEQLINATK